MRLVTKPVRHVYPLLAALLLCVTQSAGPASVPQGHYIDLIYIDANTAGSSGGHAAVRLGRHVYHYQHYPSGFFLPVRDRWKQFRRIYNDLENRNIHINRISVSPSAFLNISRFFRKQYLAMEQQMANLEQLENEKRFLVEAENPDVLHAFRGAGLFAEQTGGESLFSREEKEKIKKALQVAEKKLDAFVIKGEKSACGSTDFTCGFTCQAKTDISRYLELAHYVHALNFILQDREIRESFLFDITALAPECAPPLKQNELEALETYRDRLKADILKMTASCRNDVGWPIMLAFARMRAITRSIKTSHVMTLDTFSDRADLVKSDALKGNMAVRTIYSHQCREFISIRNAMFKRSVPEETEYNFLENSSARLHETAAHLKKGKGDIRVQNDIMIPDKHAMLPVKRPVFSKHNRRQLATTAERRYEVCKKTLENTYRYGLVDHNCVTELVKNLYRGAGDRQKGKEIFGNVIDPYDGLFFIPFIFDMEAGEKLSVNKRIFLPSRRAREKERICRENGILACLKEETTLTSLLYERYGEERGFLFFTDDATVMRPLLGALNMIYGIIYTGTGLLNLPLDNGKMLKDGGTGILFSIPELFFFNIRKGSFSVVENRESQVFQQVQADQKAKGPKTPRVPHLPDGSGPVLPREASAF